MSQTMAALMLAGTATTRSHDPLTSFGMKGKGPALPPSGFGSGGGPSGSGPGGPPGGGGGGLPGGGGAFPAIAPGALATGGGKLGGNPIRVFDGTRSKADAFMNEFNLYRLTNIGADQVDNPMKRAALLLGLIQGEDVKDWVKHWTIWSLNQYNTGLASTDEHYWNTIAGAFETAFHVIK